MDKDISKLSKSELDTLQMEVEGKFREAMESLTEAEVADNKLALEIAKLQVKRKELSEGITKGKSLVRQHSSNLRTIKLATWQKINEGER